MCYILLFFLFFSCDNYFKNQSNIDVARVEDEYLTQNQIEGIFENSTNFADSTMVLNNYINNWAANKLLIQRALVNLTEENQNRIQGLVDDYKRQRNEPFQKCDHKNILLNQKKNGRNE